MNTSLGTRPFAKRGKVWACAYILGMQLCVGTDLLIAPFNFCYILASKTVYQNDLPYLVTGDTEKQEKNHFYDVIGHQQLS